VNLKEFHRAEEERPRKNKLERKPLPQDCGSALLGDNAVRGRFFRKAMQVIKAGE
jgi:hypothetical protein